MKTKTAHTPGPWEQAPCFMIQSKNGDYICKIDASEGSEHHANAKLIAAAPDLLNALEIAEATIQRLAPDGSRATQGTRDVIRAAITKALGK